MVIIVIIGHRHSHYVAKINSLGWLTMTMTILATKATAMKAETDSDGKLKGGNESEIILFSIQSVSC